ncbi:MAG: type II secretion system F family protein [Bacteriovoracaceae bacterium]|nr:type II secretion system F family protein [Bacteriovoracaceae bacterium]
MPKFRWEGFDKTGKKMSGSLVVTTARELRATLRRDGVRVVKVIEPGILDTDFDQLMIDAGLKEPFSNKELGKFTRQLSILLSAGVPILECFEILFKQEKNPSFKNLIKLVAQDVGGGSTLNEALSKRKGFTKLYTSLIKAGEAAGILDEILNKLNEFMEKQQKLMSQLKGALMYPTIVTLVGIGVVYALMVFVVPQFVSMLTETGQELPFVTKFVIDVSDFLRAYTLQAAPLMAVAFFFFMKWKKSASGKPIWDLVTMKLPIFGGIIIKGNLASFTRTLATMLGAGVPLLDALDICLETLDNTYIAQDLLKVKVAVTEGKTITEPLKKIEYFPELVAQMVKVGEATGNLDQMLVKVSDVFEQEVEELLGNATKLIEPLILVGLGGIIATILIAMYLPMFMSAGGADAP